MFIEVYLSQKQLTAATQQAWNCITQYASNNGNIRGGE